MAEFAGALAEIVEIEQWSAVADAWQPGGCAWAALVPLDTVLTATVGDRQLGRPRFRLMLRAPAAVGLASRMRWRGRTLVVLRAEPDPRLPDRVTFLVEDRT